MTRPSGNPVAIGNKDINLRNLTDIIKHTVKYSEE